MLPPDSLISCSLTHDGMGVHPSVTGLMCFILTQSRKYVPVFRIFFKFGTSFFRLVASLPSLVVFVVLIVVVFAFLLQLHKNQRQMVKDKFKVSHCLCAVYRLVDVGGPALHQLSCLLAS